MSLADGDGRGVHAVIPVVGNGSLGDFVAGPGAVRGSLECCAVRSEDHDPALVRNSLHDTERENELLKGGGRAIAI